MKKIAIVSFFFEESTLCLAKHIAKQGVMVDFYSVNCPSSSGRIPGFEFWRAKIHWGVQQLNDKEIPEIAGYMGDLPVRLFLIAFDSSRRFSMFGLDKLTFWLDCRRMRKNHYDAIDIVGQSKAVVWCHNYLRGENITHTFHEIGSHQDGVATTPAVDVSIKDKSRVILHSLSSYKRYLALPGVDEKRVRTIPFGRFETSKLYVKDIDMNIPLDMSKPTFLFFGMIKPYKGLDTLAAATKMLSPIHDRFNLIIAGSGKDQSLAYFGSLKNCFVYNQYLGNDEMMHFIQKSTVVVLPYHSASQTGIIPTVALYGKPVIATKVGALPEMVSDGHNGLLVEKDNPEEFAEAMRRCIEDSQFLATLSDGMKSFGHGDQWDWNNIAEQTLSFITSRES